MHIKHYPFLFNSEVEEILEALSDMTLYALKYFEEDDSEMRTKIRNAERILRRLYWVE